MIESLKLKFTSGNSTPIDRAVITRDEYEQLESILKDREIRHLKFLEINLEIIKLLPGNYYMDPPDGGDVSIMDQLRRMAKDAERYRRLRDSYQDSDYLLTDPGMNTWNDELGMTVEASLDELVDAAMARDREG